MRFTDNRKGANLFVAEQRLTEEVDEVFVNGDAFIPNARTLEPAFKARMFAEVQA